MEERKICQRCILPESPPDITIDDEGICSVCRTHERVKEVDEASKPLESDLLKILKKHQGKQKYDCLVMCSGGKDSTSSLYFMKKRYGLNPLAFTFDHGFETNEALDNVHNAVEKLGVDFMFFKSGYIQDMFKRIIETNSNAVICHPCSIWYMDLAYDVAARYEIPIIVAGWTKGQSTKQEVMSKCGCNVHSPEFQSMAKATEKFLDEELPKMPKYKDFPRTMEEVLKKAKKRFKSIVISPHWFLPFGPEEYVQIIKDELDWKPPKLSYPKNSTNCSMNFISVYNSMKNFGYTHYHVEASKLIRKGVISREEALRDMQIDFDKDLLNSIAKKLNCKIE